MTIQQLPPIHDIENAFLDFLTANGIQPAGSLTILIDKGIQRYTLHDEHAGYKSGSYAVYTDSGWPIGWARDWHNGITLNWIYGGDKLTKTQDDYIHSDEFRKKAEAAKKAFEQKIIEAQNNAADEARSRIHDLPEAPEDHKYLQTKHINPYGVKLEGENLVVPMRNINGDIRSFQRIAPDGEKRFLPGGGIKGCFWSVGLDTVNPTDEATILLGEGYATMAKVYELTGKPSIAGISCGNLFSVAQALKSKYPKAKIVCMADNDSKTQLEKGTNPGIEAANNLVKNNLAVDVVVPTFTDSNGTDWDDYAILYGDEYTAGVLAEKITRATFKVNDTTHPESQGTTHGHETSAGNTNNAQSVQRVRRYSHHSVADLCKQPKAVPYLIKGYIRKGGLGMIYGESGCGKSFAILDMAVAIACEDVQTWNGNPIHHGPVIIFAGEGADGLNARLACLCNKRNINPERVQLTIIDEVFKLDCGQEDKAHSIENTIAEIKATYDNPALVIFDTLNIYMKGDENNNTDAGNFCSLGRKIIHECGCTFLIVQHIGLNPDAKNRARGASAFKAAMDFVIQLKKTDSVITLSTPKIKDGKQQQDLIFNLKQHEIPDWFDEDGEPVTSCTLELATGLMEFRASKKNDKDKLSRTALQARKTFAQTAKTSGRIIKDNKNGHDIAIVDVEEWRKNAYAMSSADNNDTKRWQFNSQRVELFEKSALLTKKIIEGQEFYCLDLNGEAEPELRAEIRLGIFDRETAKGRNATAQANAEAERRATRDIFE